MSQQLEQLAQSKGMPSDVAEYSVKMLHSDMAGMDPSMNHRSYTGSSTTATDSIQPLVNGGGGTSGASQSATSEWNDPTKDRHYKNLASKNGAAFDKDYISTMVSDHEDDIAMFEKEAKKGDDPAVRSFAQSRLSKLQEHLSRAQQMAGTLKSGG